MENETSKDWGAKMQQTILHWYGCNIEDQGPIINIWGSEISIIHGGISGVFPQGGLFRHGKGEITVKGTSEALCQQAFALSILLNFHNRTA